MYIHKGGEMYSFCPGKATWDASLKMLFDELILISQMKILPYPGGLYDQPAWLVELLAWFVPKYDFITFLRKADTILGGSDGKTIKAAASNAPVRARRR